MCKCKNNIYIWSLVYILYKPSLIPAYPFHGDEYEDKTCAHVKECVDTVQFGFWVSSIHVVFDSGLDGIVCSSDC